MKKKIKCLERQCIEEPSQFTSQFKALRIHGRDGAIRCHLCSHLFIYFFYSFIFFPLLPPLTFLSSFYYSPLSPISDTHIWMVVESSTEVCLAYERPSPQRKWTFFSNNLQLSVGSLTFNSICNFFKMSFVVCVSTRILITNAM